MRNLLASLSLSLKFCVFGLFVLVSTKSLAQTVGSSNLNCTDGSRCTSKDLSVVDVFVSAPPCAICSGGNVTYPLNMTIHNGTNSVRTSFALYGTLSSGASIGGQSGNVFICVGPIPAGNTLPGGNKTFLVGNITFPCGQSLTLTNNFLAWTDASGTTSDRCTTFSQATSCADIAPKCGTAASITIRQPLTATSSATTSCSNSATGSVTVTVTSGAGTAPYVITIAGQTFSAGSPKTKSALAGGTYNYSVTDAANCTFTGTQNVSTVSCCATPTIQTNPSGSSKCPGSSTTFTASATGGNPTPTIQWQEQIGAGAFANITDGGVYSGATTGTLSISDVTGKNGNHYRAVFTSAGCDPATSGSALLTVFANPTAAATTYHAPNCDEAFFSVEVTNVVNGETYEIKDKNGAAISGVLPSSSVTAASTSNITFSHIPAGSGFEVNVSANGCSGNAPVPCGTPGSVNKAISSTQETVQSQTTTVKAYPNPFSDKINFVVTTPISGKGTLEVYNMMGQKVKTVYQGFISAGSQTFQMSSPRQQVANLIYVLRIGDKKISGKILQINQ
jgi:hypothetical protein